MKQGNLNFPCRTVGRLSIIIWLAGTGQLSVNRQRSRAAIAKPIDTAPIRQLAKGKKEVAIIFDDMTRATRVADIVPFVLEELAEAGIPDNKIRFICALG